MFYYPFYQWLLFFFIYCFAGWIWETFYVSVTERHFVNRGFMYGTWIPIYGFGALIMLFSTLPFKDNWVMVYLVGMIAATILELCTGLLMEKIFKIKYWDYSNQHIQFKGYICLSSSLFWGLCSVVLVKWIHSFVEKILNDIPSNAQIPLACVLSALFLTDLGFSIKAALDIRAVIVKMEKLRDELAEAVSERRDELADFLVGKREEFADLVNEKREEISDLVSEKRDEATAMAAATREEIVERIDKAKEDISERTRVAKENLELQQEKLKLLSARLVKRNPSALLPSLPYMNSILKEIRKKTHWGKDK